jgi:hypothetical protein
MEEYFSIFNCRAFLILSDIWKTVQFSLEFLVRSYIGGSEGAGLEW